MYIKRKTCDIRTWKKQLFLNISSTNTDTLVPLLYRCVKTHTIEIFLTVVSATSAPLFEPLPHQQNVCHQVGFLADQTDGSQQGPSLGCKANVEEVPNVVLEFSPGLLGLYGVWHYHDEAAPLLPVSLDVFCELQPKASTEFHSMIQSSHFHHTSVNGLTALPENPTTRQA
jgi:hypothetical protein